MNFAGLNVLFFTIFFVFILVLYNLSVRIFEFIYLLKQEVVFLELIPLASKNKDTVSTEELFSVLHGLRGPRTLLEILFRRRLALSLEVVSTLKDGIRFIACIPSSELAVFRQNVFSYMPEIEIKAIDDYLPTAFNAKLTRSIEFKQSHHFAYPLKSHSIFGVHDPVAYLAGAMNKLEGDEKIIMQLQVTPINSNRANRISERIVKNQNARARLSKRYYFEKLLSSVLFIVSLPFKIVILPLLIISRVLLIITGGRPPRIDESFDKIASKVENELTSGIYDKLKQPLFRVSLRAVIISPSKKREKIKGLSSSMATFSVPKYQSLRIRHTLVPLFQRYRLFLISNRLPVFLKHNSLILSCSELVALYHFPQSLGAKTENVVRNLSRTLPPPVSLQESEKLDILLGENNYHGSLTPIGLTKEERERHVYIIGGTGNGKTTLLQAAIVEDIARGKGLAVIDPHGDLAVEVLRRIPEDRVDDVIYVNPDDAVLPVAINLLELPKGLSGVALLQAKDRICESTISVLRKQFSENDSGGHRIEYVLRNCIQTALHVEGATLFTIYRLLTDVTYQHYVLRKIADQDLVNFWRNEMGRAGDYQRVKMSAGITAKIGRFLFSSSARNMLEHAESSIDFDDILATGKILICNFSKGTLGEDTSSLLGTMILAKLQLAALARARLPSSERRAYHIYVDEFQNFATSSFVQMLSEARKYKLFVTMAEQSMAQQENNNFSTIILANVGTLICFRTGSPEDERLLLPLFSPWIEQGELLNLPSFAFYMRLAATVPREPFSGMTIAPRKPEVDMGDRVIATSRRHYGRAVVSRPEAGLPDKSRPEKPVRYSADPMGSRVAH